MQSITDPILVRIYGSEDQARKVDAELCKLEPSYRQRVIQVTENATVTRPGWYVQHCLVKIEAENSDDQDTVKKILEPLLDSKSFLFIKRGPCLPTI